MKGVYIFMNKQFTKINKNYKRTIATLMVFIFICSMGVSNVYAEIPTWEWTEPVASTATGIYSSAYSENIDTTVAVGQNGVILTKVGDEAWQKQYATGYTTLKKVEYINGQFIAVGQGSTIETSTDGLSWDKKNFDLGSSYGFEDIAYGNGNYVIVALGGEVFVSTTLDSFNQLDSGTTRLYGVEFGNGKFIAISENGVVSTTVNTVDWTNSLVIPAEYNFKSIMFHNGNFIMTAKYNKSSTVARIYKTSDGSNFEQLLNATGRDFVGLDYGDGFYVAQSKEGRFYFAEDLSTWTQNAGIFSHLDTITSFDYVDGKFLAIGNSEYYLDNVGYVAPVVEDEVGVTNFSIPIRIQSTTSGEKPVGDILENYKDMLVKVDSTEENKMLNKITRVLSEIGQPSSFKPSLTKGINEIGK